MFDLVIKDGFVIDGTGRDRFRADVGISGERIAAIGELDADGKRIIQADGCIVSPGFIDIHSHTDELVFANRTCESKVTQGVTTEVSGNCGYSAAPRGGLRVDDGGEEAVALADCGVKPDWKSMGEFLSRLDGLPMTINFATLVGHGAVRSVAMGYSGRTPNPNEMATMRRLVAQSLEEGAFGISTGLIYPPGCYADTGELIELARVAARHGGIYATHMRSESDSLIGAVEEALEIGRAAGISVQISHHKASGQKNWGKVKLSLEMIDDARSDGIDVWADQYPYMATCTNLGVLLPKWAHDGGKQALMTRLRSVDQRRRLREELVRDSSDGWIRDTGGWETIVLGMVRQEKSRTFEGLNIAEIAQKTDKHPADVVLDILVQEEAGAGIMHFVIDEKDVLMVMQHPAVLIGSDATARATTGLLSQGKPHPRTYGTFPRVLGKYSRQEGIFTLEEAVAKMTGRTAKRLALRDRGILAEGYFADITVFDPAQVLDTATFANPHSHAQGIRHVLVNGSVVVEDGSLAESAPQGSGKVLRRA